MDLASASSPDIVVIAAPPAKAGMYRFINLKLSMTAGIAVEKAPYSKAWTTSSAILSSGVLGKIPTKSFNAFISFANNDLENVLSSPKTFSSIPIAPPTPPDIKKAGYLEHQHFLMLYTLELNKLNLDP